MTILTDMKIKPHEAIKLYEASRRKTTIFFNGNEIMMSFNTVRVVLY